MAFPPSKAKGGAPVQPQDVAPAPVSTGNGGIPKSLKVKAAGTKDAPGLEKNVNAF